MRSVIATVKWGAEHLGDAYFLLLAGAAVAGVAVAAFAVAKSVF